MATATITRQAGDVIDGRPTFTYNIVQAGAILVSDEWVIEGVPRQATITLLESFIVTLDGFTTIQPEIGWIAGWTTDQKGHIDRAIAAAGVNDAIRIGQNKRVTNSDGKIYGRTNVDQNTGGSAAVLTVISITTGHI